MALFTILKHPSKLDYKLVKNGYIAPIFLPIFWQLSKGLSIKALVEFFALLLSLPFLLINMNSGINITLAIIGALIHVSSIESASKDYMNLLLKKGYKKEKVVNADNEEEALNKYLENK